MVRSANRVTLSLLVLCLAALNVHSAERVRPDSAKDALKAMMSERHVAQNMASPNASPQTLQQAAAQLELLLKRLEEQPYRDFSSAEGFLYAERLNIALPLAQIYARLGDKEKALLALESTTGTLLAPLLARIADDPAFASIRDEPRFKAVFAKYRKGGIASSKSFATPFSETLTREQRVAGLSLFWSEVRHNFANVDLMPPLDWDATYLEYLGKVLEAKTTADYYAILMQLAPLLHDGHTNIYPPEQLVPRFFARPPLETELVEEAVVVRAVHDESLKQSIRPGDEIVAINGIEVKKYAETFVRPFVSSSTEQDRNVRMYSYQLLAGDEKVPVSLTIKGALKDEHRIKVSRSGWERRPEERFPFHISPTGVAYLRLDHFESDESVRAFKQALPEIRRAKGLILDVRTNGGGSTGFALTILSYLAESPIQLTRARVRFEDQQLRAQAGDSVSWRPLLEDSFTSDVPADQRFDGPVALLIGPKTYSAAEDFVAIFKQAGRGILVGEATGGSTGQPLMLALPGGGGARICIKRDSYADGTDFVGQGIAPTFTVRNSVAAVREGADPVLVQAQELLLSSPNPHAASDRQRLSPANRGHDLPTLDSRTTNNSAS
jgi:C-terminal processing protease CtpA/Prc